MNKPIGVNMKLFKIYLFCFVVGMMLLVVSCKTTEDVTVNDPIEETNKIPQLFLPSCEPTQRIIFYNLENLFDFQHDSLKNDTEFLPEGVRGWSKTKFYEKLNRLYKVFMACGYPGNPPAVIGVCEVENDFALTKLIENTPLKDFGYQFVHYEAADVRGVDVALLYRPDLFDLFDSRPFPVVFPFDTASKTRDILYVKGLLFGQDMIHIFINHWPSRYGGQAATINKRNYVAGYLRSICDSILNENPSSNILIMGDLNDDPTDASLVDYLTAPHSETDTLHPVNLTLPLAERGEGTLKHGTGWNLFDQVIVSPALQKGTKGLQICGEPVIFKFDFLLVDDETNGGKKLFRTYNGMNYAGGFADHLPVGVDIKKQ
ncbi:MAG: endonuclease [Bacteroidales bacterium]|nr:endonuclease [Bacteroidales bacterium]